MSSWWYCESMDAYYNLSTISKIKFIEPKCGPYKIELYNNLNDVAFCIEYEYDYDDRHMYKKEKREIMELIGQKYELIDEY